MQALISKYRTSNETVSEQFEDYNDNDVIKYLFR